MAGIEDIYTQSVGATSTLGNFGMISIMLFSHLKKFENCTIVIYLCICIELVFVLRFSQGYFLRCQKDILFPDARPLEGNCVY